MSDYIPKSDSLRGRVCRLILNHGDMCFKTLMGHLPAHRSNTVRDAVTQLKFHRAIEEANGVYGLSLKMQMHYGLVPSTKPEAPTDWKAEWKPWSGKYSIGRELPRPDAQPLRDISFKTGSAGYFTQQRD